jgi:hypothetical protein
MPDGAYIELFSFTYPESHSYTFKFIPRGAPQPTMSKKKLWLGRLRIYGGTPPSRRPPLSAVLPERSGDVGSSTWYEAEVAGGPKRSSDDFERIGEIMPPARWVQKGGKRVPFFSGDLTPRDLRVRARVENQYLTPLLAATIGDNATDIEHQAPQWRAEHHACPRAGPT